MGTKLIEIKVKPPMTTRLSFVAQSLLRKIYVRIL